MRDLLLGMNTSSKDIDLMVELSTEKVLTQSLEILKNKKKIRNFLKVGKSFPVFKIHCFEPHCDIDLALARKEVSTGIGHRDFAVDSSKISALEDAKRRDFTVNAMFLKLSLENGELGWELIDPFDGQKDLQSRLLRTVGNTLDRIREDPLRMLRALRFVYQKGFSLTNELETTIIEKSAEWIPTVSSDRIQDEFLKTLVVDLQGAYQDYLNLGLLESCFPKLISLLPKSAQALPEVCGENQDFSEELVFPMLLLPWLKYQEFKPQDGEMKKVENLLRGYHIPNPKRIRTLLSQFCTLSNRFQTPYPKSLQEKCFDSAWGEDLKFLYELYGTSYQLPPLDRLGPPPPKINGREFLDWGFPPQRGLEEIILKAREMQWNGIRESDEIRKALSNEYLPDA